MKKIDLHLHCPDGPDFQNGLDRYVNWMERHEVVAGLVHALPRPGRDNEAVLAAIRRHPGRLYGSCYVDLLLPLTECVETARRYAGEGFKSIKLFPNYGYDPNDERYEPFWDEIEKLGLFCLSHCGWMGYGPQETRARLSCLTATPFHFELPARMHPGINFVFAHFGGAAAYLETVTLLARLPNCYADTCPGWGRWIWEQRLPGLGTVPTNKVLYGTDLTGSENGYAADEAFWSKLLAEFGRSPQEVAQYFYGNAARLLGLKA